MHEDDWQPATSKPGEIDTPDGRARAAGNFVRNLRYRDPRGASYRAGMLRMGFVFAGTGLLVVVLVSLLTALFF